MEKNGKIELGLSEEQLQEITGGCAQCTADLNQINHHRTLAQGYLKISDAAEAKGKDTTMYDDLFAGHVDAAKNLMNGLLARGHVKLPLPRS